MGFVSKRNKICLSLNVKSVCVCLCLSHDGTFSLLRVEFSLFRAQAKTLQVSPIEMEELQIKFKDLPG